MQETLHTMAYLFKQYSRIRNISTGEWLANQNVKTLFAEPGSEQEELLLGILISEANGRIVEWNVF